MIDIFGQLHQLIIGNYLITQAAIGSRGNNRLLFISALVAAPAQGRCRQQALVTG